MKLPIRIRRQFAEDPEVGEQWRDIQRAFDSMPTVLFRQVEMQYSEPLVLGNMVNSPDAIEAVRVTELAAVETPVHVGGVCDFVWRPDRGGAQITGINGMSVAAHGGKLYRFLFRLSYVAVGGFSV